MIRALWGARATAAPGPTEPAHLSPLWCGTKCSLPAPTASVLPREQDPQCGPAERQGKSGAQVCLQNPKQPPRPSLALPRSSVHRPVHKGSSRQAASARGSRAPGYRGSRSSSLNYYFKKIKLKFKLHPGLVLQLHVVSPPLVLSREDRQVANQEACCGISQCLRSALKIRSVTYVLNISPALSA